MSRTFDDLIIGGVFIAPFVTYAAAALVLFLLLRPVLAWTGFERLFSAPPIALLAVYVLILTILILLA